MCGIAGIIEYSANEPSISESLLKRMSDVIAHRGPDDEGHFLSSDRRCGFAFRRLAIVDLSPAGHQPMTTEDGRFTLVFNGEVYNHLELRADLERKGYSYKSRSDTETILYGLRQYGAEFFRKMIGMWGIALWDAEKKELLLSRDRIGIKPLYYAEQNGKFWFASEIKSILQDASFRAEVNYNEIPNYLTFCASGEHETLFKGIHKVPAGHTLKLSANGEIRLERYWHPLEKSRENSARDSQETIEEILRLLRQSVKDRMMSDVPFGAFLSGGIDSSVNVALMSELMSRPVDTFTVGFRALEKYNELEFAGKVAKKFGTNHHEILIDEKDVFPILEQLPWHEDEPNADTTCIPLWFVSKLTRESGTVVIQTGEGSDEQFAGYPWMLRDLRFYHSYWRAFNLLPRIFRKGMYAAVEPFFAAKHNYLALDYVRRSADNQELYWGGGVITPQTLLTRLLSQKFSSFAGLPAELPARYHAEILAKKPDADYLQRMEFVEFSQRIPEMILGRTDKITMAHSLEARVPFLDHRLVEFTMTIPEHIKNPDGKTAKYLLKKAAESLLPHDIIYRKKMGFVAPTDEWFRGDLGKYWDKTVLGSRLMETGMFNPDGLRTLLKAHQTGRKKFGKPLYALLNLALWYERFFR